MIIGLLFFTPFVVLMATFMTFFFAGGVGLIGMGLVGWFADVSPKAPKWVQAPAPNVPVPGAPQAAPGAPQAYTGGPPPPLPQKEAIALEAPPQSPAAHPQVPVPGATEVPEDLVPPSGEQAPPDDSRVVLTDEITSDAAPPSAEPDDGTEPQPPQHLEFSNAIWHYVRATAFARKGELPAAQSEYDKLVPLRKAADVTHLDTI